ncbi:MAG: hypothetical protein AAFX40_10915 [Cyanobacteria bacterium J06639_1]
MLSKSIALATLVIALLAIYSSYTQVGALHLSQSQQRRQRQQRYYWGRSGMVLSGRRYRDRWEPTPNRQTYSTFRGGGIGSGK